MTQQQAPSTPASLAAATSSHSQGIEISKAWLHVIREIERQFSSNNNNSSGSINSVDANAFKQSVDFLIAHGFVQLIDGFTFDKIKHYFKTIVVPRFWSHFKGLQRLKHEVSKNEFESTIVRQFATAISELHTTIVSSYLPIISMLEDSITVHQQQQRHNQQKQYIFRSAHKRVGSNFAVRTSPTYTLLRQRFLQFVNASIFSYFSDGALAFDNSAQVRFFKDTALPIFFKKSFQSFHRQQRLISQGVGDEEAEGDYDDDDDDDFKTAVSQSNVETVGNNNQIEGDNNSSSDDDERENTLKTALQEDAIGRFKRLCGQMREIGIIVNTKDTTRGNNINNNSGDVRGDIVTDACIKEVYRRLENRVRKWCAGDFTGEERKLPRVRRWVHQTILPWLRAFFYTTLPTTGSNISASIGGASSLNTSLNTSSNIGSDDGSDRDESTLNLTMATAAAESEYRQWEARVEFFVYHSLAMLRISELFDIIVDMPDSVPSLEDLKECLIKTEGLHNNDLVVSLKNSISKRLLVAGANTSDIITQFISTIRALQILDPTGISLKCVSRNIRSYLRQRPDTIRCIVSGLIDEDTPSELYTELSNVENARSGKSGGGEGGDSDSEDEDFDNWMPPPIYADPRATPSSSRKGPDIIKMLVSIYHGNKDLFISEYRSLLADQLLAKLDYDTDKAVRIIELLKLRFGESSLQNCEVMIKDMADSKRINNNIHNAMVAEAKKKKATAPTQSAVVVDHSRGGHVNIEVIPAKQSTTGSNNNNNNNDDDDDSNPTPLNATIVSRNFWPDMPEDEDHIVMHPVVQSMLAEYERHYTSLKAPRKLLWKRHIGSVFLDLEIGGKTLTSLCVSPIHATIIMHFADKKTWTMGELCQVMSAPIESLFKRVLFWVNAGVLRQCPGTPTSMSPDAAFEVVEATDESTSASASASSLGVTGGASASTVVVDMEDDAGDDSVSAREAQLAKEMLVYEKFIIGMITNFNSMPIEKIHNMLKMFVVDHTYDKTIQQLGSFLNNLVAEDKLVFEAGQYKLKK